MINDFHQISIRGRYIYCYLCLRNVIIAKSFEDIPGFLAAILKAFTSSSRLDDWQDEADDIMPSRLLEDENDMTLLKFISQEKAKDLIEYYKNDLAANVIEELIWLGVSNLYSGFNSNITFRYVGATIELLQNNKVALPDFSIVSSCSVNEKGGWGNRVNLDDFFKTIV